MADHDASQLQDGDEEEDQGRGLGIQTDATATCPHFLTCRHSDERSALLTIFQSNVLVMDWSHSVSFKRQASTRKSKVARVLSRFRARPQTFCDVLYAAALIDRKQFALTNYREKYKIGSYYSRRILRFFASIKSEKEWARKSHNVRSVTSRGRDVPGDSPLFRCHERREGFFTHNRCRNIRDVPRARLRPHIECLRTQLHARR